MKENLGDAKYRQEVLAGFYPLSNYFKPNNLHDFVRARFNPKTMQWELKTVKDALKESPPKQTPNRFREPRLLEARERKPTDKRMTRRELFARLRPRRV